MKKYVQQSLLYSVKEISEVRIPTLEFPGVPYFVYLLEDDDGKKIIWNSTIRYKKNEKIAINNVKTSNVFRIGIVGSGVTGCGIAAVALKSGCSVIMFVRNMKNNENVKDKIRHLLNSIVGPEDVDRIIKLFTIVNSIDVLRQTELVIEAIDENFDAKQDLYMRLEKTLKPDTIIATNTSSFSIDRLSSKLHNKSKFIGMHFFNPVTKMKLVEIIKGKYSSNETVLFTQKVASVFGKQIVVLQSGKEGFIVNRLLFAFLSEAIKIYEEKIADVHDIDKAVELGLNHPLGPFKLMDLIGIDVCLDILNNLSHLYVKPIKLSGLRGLVKKGHIGKKAKSGFYRYNP